MAKKREKKEKKASTTHYLSYLIQLALSVAAAYLNWSCLQNQSIMIRVLTTVLAFFFAVYYLVFYLVFKVILGQTC
jgi:hypothetical protein